MFASISLITLKPGLTVTWAEQWVALIVRQTGFRGFLSLQGEEPSRLIVITLWESPGAAGAWEHNQEYIEMRDDAIAPMIAEMAVVPTTVQGAVFGFDGR